MNFPRARARKSDIMSLAAQFGPILGKCLQDEKAYLSRPPQGPPDFCPLISQEALAGLSRNGVGEDTGVKGEGMYEDIALVEETPCPVSIPVPSLEDLADIYVCGIDGSNQRVKRGGFHFILSRAVMVVFRYSKIPLNRKPYFYRHFEDAAAVVLVDGNVFDKDAIAIHTRWIPRKTRQPGQKQGENILSELERGGDNPLMFRYAAGQHSPGPSAQALGLAVQIQQGLELLCVPRTPHNAQATVCIKDGPLLATSTTPEDVRSGLRPILSWGARSHFVACSKRVGEATLLWQMLLDPSRGATWREQWFLHGQNITDSTIRSLPSDSLLLPRILKPGHRTPMVKAVLTARKGIVQGDNGIPELTPVACYYLSRTQPNTYMRLEMPLFMWERDPRAAAQAIKIAIWQHELDHSAPLVINAAHRMCDISHERGILEMQTDAALFKKKLNFPKDYED